MLHNIHHNIILFMGTGGTAYVQNIFKFHIYTIRGGLKKNLRAPN